MPALNGSECRDRRRSGAHAGARSANSTGSGAAGSRLGTATRRPHGRGLRLLVQVGAGVADRAACQRCQRWWETALTGTLRDSGGTVGYERQANWHMTEGESPLERRSSQSTFLREPCVGTCEGAGEASAAVRAGRVMERRKIRHLECRDSVLGRRQHRSSQYGEDRPGSTASKNSGTCVRHIPGPGRSSGRPGGSSPGPRREGVRLDQR